MLRQKKIGQARCLQTDQNIRLSVDQSESAQSLHLSPEALATSLQPYDIISFDVFDTLIFRPFQTPQDIFFRLEQKLEYPGLKKIRQMAEQEIRCGENQNEVTLKEIWERVELLSGVDASTGMKAELDTEFEVCCANPYFVSVVACLREAGKKMIVCSDMYLGRETIAELLRKCGYPDFDDIFVSCEYRASKAEGRLFDIVREKYGTHTTYLHIGDNQYSDGIQARKKHFDIWLYQNVNQAGQPFRPKDISPVVSSIYSGIVNTHLHNGLTARSIPYEFGFVYGGLLVTGYCQFIHDYVEKNQIERILFFARDGDVICKAYRIMYAIIINDAYFAFLEDDELLSNFVEQIRLLWSFEIQRELTDNTETISDGTTESEYEDRGTIVTSDPFVVYISGNDSSGKLKSVGRSDVNVLMAVNPSTNEILLVSTPRDYFVEISVADGAKDKLTHAGIYGIDVSMDALENLYQVPIQYYIRLNFSGFINIIDALGGVTVESDVEFSVGDWHYTIGENQLTGIEALAFARERYSFASGDRQRGKNQEAVIKAVIKKVASPAILLNYAELMDAVSGTVETNFSQDEITSLVQMQLSEGKEWSVTAISVDGTDNKGPCYSIPNSNVYRMIPNMESVDYVIAQLQVILGLT